MNGDEYLDPTPLTKKVLLGLGFNVTETFDDKSGWVLETTHVGLRLQVIITPKNYMSWNYPNVGLSLKPKTVGDFKMILHLLEINQ